MTFRIRAWGVGITISILLLLFFISGLQHVNLLTQEIHQGIDQTNKDKVLLLLKTERQSIESMLDMQTWWDDMVDYVETRDQEFADVNVEDQLEPYGLEAGFIFTPDFECIYSATAEDDTVLPPPLKRADVQAAFTADRFAHFFITSAKQVFEYFGATIHPDDDKECKTTPRGYMMVVRQWDEGLIENISKLSASTVTLSGVDANDLIPSNTTDNSRFTIPLVDLHGAEAGVMHFSQQLGYIKDHQAITQRYIAHLVGYYLLLATVLWLGLHIWTLRPMKKIAKSIHEDSIEPIHNLTHYTEVSEIAKSITVRLRQAVELEKAMKQVEAANRAKSQFLRNLSHEFKTPLNGVFGATQLLKSTQMDAEQNEYVDIISDSGKHLDLLIDELLTLSRLVNDSFDLKEGPLDLTSLLQNTTETYKKKADTAGIRFEYHDSTPPVPKALHGDEFCIREIIKQLMHNAFKFTDSGKIILAVQLIQDDPESVQIRLSISDTGIGLPADRLDELMDLFTQADSSDTRKHEGLGIGLALARALTLKIGGRIDVESEEGKGSCFNVEFPLHKLPEEERESLDHDSLVAADSFSADSE